MYRFAVSQNVLLRMKANSGLVEVWFPNPAGWHVLPEMEAWFEGRPVSSDEATAEFPGVELEGPRVVDEDWTPGPEPSEAI